MATSSGGRADSLLLTGRAVGFLANTMRLYVGAWMGFAAIFDVDREEATKNVDRAFEAKLNALHSLYDVLKDLFAWSITGAPQAASCPGGR